MKLLTDGSVEGIKTRQDGSVVFTLATQELDAESVGRLFAFRNKYVKCLLSDTNVTKIEEELIDSEQIVNGKKTKSAAQRLRNVLFLVNKSNGGDEDSFDTFYKSEMERVIEHYKSKLSD